MRTMLVRKMRWSGCVAAACDRIGTDVAFRSHWPPCSLLDSTIRPPCRLSRIATLIPEALYLLSIFLQEFDNIVYISCNPETLAANLRSIASTHSIQRFAAFDQFPYTHHLECGVYLVRR